MRRSLLNEEDVPGDVVEMMLSDLDATISNAARRIVASQQPTDVVATPAPPPPVVTATRPQSSDGMPSDIWFDEHPQNPPVG